MRDIEKAIDDLKDINKALKVQHMIKDMDGETTREDIKIYRSRFASVNLGIFALKKQVPKKAEYHHKANGECALIICSNCESRLTGARYIFPLDRYCKECGQHYVVDIKDWSVEE